MYDEEMNHDDMMKEPMTAEAKKCAVMQHIGHYISLAFAEDNPKHLDGAKKAIDMAKQMLQTVSREDAPKVFGGKRDI